MLLRGIGIQKGLQLRSPLEYCTHQVGLFYCQNPAVCTIKASAGFTTFTHYTLLRLII